MPRRPTPNSSTAVEGAGHSLEDIRRPLTTSTASAFGKPGRGRLAVRTYAIRVTDDLRQERHTSRTSSVATARYGCVTCPSPRSTIARLTATSRPPSRPQPAHPRSSVSAGAGASGPGPWISTDAVLQDGEAVRDRGRQVPTVDVPLRLSRLNDATHRRGQHRWDERVT